MEPDTSRERPFRTGVYLFLALTALGVALAYYRLGATGPESYEALARVGVGHDLLDGAPRGRQGLVGSLRWAPLPTLLEMPLLRIPGLEEGTFAASVVSVMGAACLCVFLSRWWSQYGMREIIRTPIAFALFLSPPMLRPVLEGSSSTLFAFLVVAAVAHLIHWWETEQPTDKGLAAPASTDKTVKLRSLAYTAVAAGAAVFVRYQAVVLLAAVTLLFTVHLIVNRKRESYVEATLITLLLPGLYLVALWFAANWLIMGNALFFLRGLRTYAGHGAALALLSEGCEWSACVTPAAIGLLGWAVCRLARGRRSALTGLPCLLVCGALWLPGLGAIEPAPPDPTTVELRNTVLPYLLKRHAEDRILVGGYRGYQVRKLTPHHPGLIVHELSVYMDTALDRTRGRKLYLLAPNPRMRDPHEENIDRWEDANLQFPGVYERGARGLLFERNWGHWSLWRVVRIDTPEQPV